MPTQRQHAFSEKVSLITDGTSPIGRAIAMQLALLGSYVVVGVPKISEEDRRALDELKSLGTLANYFEVDVSTVEGVKELVSEVENLYGRLDLLVNCLKYEGDSEFENTSPESFDRIVDSNLKSTFFTIQKSMRLMKARPKPKIVNVLSACDSDGADQNTAFVAINSALKGLTESLAKTLPKKFRINAVEISEIEKTKAQDDELDSELFRVKKGIDEDDVARTIIYLLSSDSIVINGQTLFIE